MDFIEAAVMMDGISQKALEQIDHLKKVLDEIDDLLPICQSVFQSARGTGHATHIEECISTLEIAKDGIDDASDVFIKTSLTAINAAASLRG